MSIAKSRSLPVVFEGGGGSRASAPCGGQGAMPPAVDEILKFDNAKTQFPCIFYWLF